jgi:hypothetical protein
MVEDHSSQYDSDDSLIHVSEYYDPSEMDGFIVNTDEEGTNDENADSEISDNEEPNISYSRTGFMDLVQASEIDSDSDPLEVRGSRYPTRQRYQQQSQHQRSVATSRTPPISYRKSTPTLRQLAGNACPRFSSDEESEDEGTGASLRQQESEDEDENYSEHESDLLELSASGTIKKNVIDSSDDEEDANHELQSQNSNKNNAMDTSSDDNEDEQISRSAVDSSPRKNVIMSSDEDDSDDDIVLTSSNIFADLINEAQDMSKSMNWKTCRRLRVSIIFAVRENLSL